MDRVRIGFVGTGRMAQLAHIPNLAEHPGCELVAIAEPRLELGSQIARKYGIPKIYGSHRELAADPEVDAVVETTRDEAHAPVSIDLLEAGKHVLVEKPLATNVSDGRRMVEAATVANAIIMVNFMRRFDPGVQLAKRLVDQYRKSGELGRIESVRAHRFGNDWSYYNVEKWIASDEPYPEMAMSPPSWVPQELCDRFKDFNNVFCHNVDLLTHLLGPVSGVEYADIGEDASLVVLGFGGFSSTLTGGSRAAAMLDEAVKIYFSDGWVELKLPPPLLRNVPAHVEVCKAGAETEVLTPRPSWGWSFKRAADHFIECVADRKEPRTSGVEALKNLELMEAIFRKYVRQ